MASPGNANNLYIIVSVTDTNGAGVARLAIGNFAILALKLLGRVEVPAILVLLPMAN